MYSHIVTVGITMFFTLILLLLTTWIVHSFISLSCYFTRPQIPFFIFPLANFWVICKSLNLACDKCGADITGQCGPFQDDPWGITLLLTHFYSLSRVWPNPSLAAKGWGEWLLSRESILKARMGSNMFLANLFHILSHRNPQEKSRFHDCRFIPRFFILLIRASIVSRCCLKAMSC